MALSEGIRQAVEEALKAGADFQKLFRRFETAEREVAWQCTVANHEEKLDMVRSLAQRWRDSGCGKRALCGAEILEILERKDWL